MHTSLCMLLCGRHNQLVSSAQLTQLNSLPICFQLAGLSVCHCLASFCCQQVRMGFPQKAADGPTAVAFVGADCLLQSGGFTCPRCKARVLDLPSTCHVCGLTLVSSSQLARSYHHLFPVKPFVEIIGSHLSLQVKPLTLCHAPDGTAKHMMFPVQTADFLHTHILSSQLCMMRFWQYLSVW